MNLLHTKINSKKVKIAIVGLGYVGLPLLKTLTSKGFKTFGVDTNIEKINSLNQKNKNNPIFDLLKNNKKKTQISNDFSIIKHCDAIIICVPTPLKKNKKPELKYIKSAIKNIFPYLRPDQLISLESTTFPGTTEQEIINKINNKKVIIVNGNFFFGIFLR